jgi:hypothetical protein
VEGEGGVGRREKGKRKEGEEGRGRRGMRKEGGGRVEGGGWREETEGEGSEGGRGYLKEEGGREEQRGEAYWYAMYCKQGCVQLPLKTARSFKKKANPVSLA